MRWAPVFEAAAEAAVAQLGAGPVRVLADRVEAGWPDHATRQSVPIPGFTAAAQTVLAAQQTAQISNAEAAAYLRGLAAGHAQQAAAIRIESVWSGPSTHPVPVRATAQVLVELVAEATRELLLMTYSAKPYPPLLEALSAAVNRGVSIDIVVETIGGAGSALSGTEPAAAFISIPDVNLWHWPLAERGEEKPKMHAKLAVADRRTLLVTSANLTPSGIANNIEAGVLVQGGNTPRRAAEHIAELQAAGVLTRLRVGT